MTLFLVLCYYLRGFSVLLVLLLLVASLVLRFVVFHISCVVSVVGLRVGVLLLMYVPLIGLRVGVCWVGLGLRLVVVGRTVWFCVWFLFFWFCALGSFGFGCVLRGLWLFACALFSYGNEGLVWVFLFCEVFVWVFV